MQTVLTLKSDMHGLKKGQRVTDPKLVAEILASDMAAHVTRSMVATPAAASPASAGAAAPVESLLLGGLLGMKAPLKK